MPAEMQVNPQTGFLEVTSKKINSFDSDKKSQILQLLADFAESGKWPNVSRICKMLNVSPSVFYDHLQIDAEFKLAYENAVAALEDSLAENLVRQGQNANGITANIFLLKNRWPQRWNDGLNFNLRGDTGALREFIGGHRGFIDAEEVLTPLNTVDKNGIVNESKSLTAINSDGNVNKVNNPSSSEVTTPPTPMTLTDPYHDRKK